VLLDGYIRVSQVRGRKGESFQSPGVQREEIARHIASRKAQVGEIFEELDESGGRADRPLLLEAIERVESGASDGIVVAKLHRFGRSFLDGLAMIARIQKAGGTLISVQQGLDLQTPTGKLVSRVLFAVAEWELDQARENWEIARGRAISRGVYICRRAPIGYRKGEDGRLVVEPEKAPMIREVFERRARGQGLAEIAQFLNGAEIEAANGVPFTRDAVYRILINSAYRGEAHSGHHRNPTAHEAIVEPSLWQQAQRPQRKPRNTIETLLSGMVRCATCGGLLSPQRPTERHRFPYTLYRCHAMTGSCPAPAQARADELEPLIEHFLFDGLPGLGTASEDEATAACEAAVAKAERDLDAYRDSPNLLLRLGHDSFEAGLERRQQTLERRLLELARARKGVRAPNVDFARLEDEWPQLDWEARQAPLRELIDCIIVARGAEPLTQRARIFRRGRGPIIGNERQIGPIDPKGSRRLAPPKPWSERRIERELGAFLGERTAWPDYLEFARAGRARLHAQMMACGGPYWWGAKLGPQVPKGFVRWSPAKVGAGLKPFLRGRKSWPEKAEFEAAGLAALHNAIRTHGGTSHWAEHFGIPYETRANERWSKKRIEDKFRETMGEFDHMPMKREFEALGQGHLYMAMRSHGGIDYWAERLELERLAGWPTRAPVSRGCEAPATVR
jgi:DNA invertase Pin-like site-specific DNA recombinase